MITSKCKEHLKEADETIIQHMFYALKIAVILQLLVPILIIHSIVPRLFTKTASNTMKNILEKR